MTEKSQMLTMRILLVFFILVSSVIAIIQVKYNVAFIAQMMGISWGALAGAFLAPFMYGLYSKRISTAAVWASYIAGVGITVSNMFLHFIQSPINAGAIAMIAGLIIVPIVSLITPAPDKQFVEEVFSGYEQRVWVRKSHSLEEED
jgi:SSS family solute:Na+ symporter